MELATTGIEIGIELDQTAEGIKARFKPSDADVLASLPGYRPNVKGHPRMIKEAARMILASERPVLYVGGGVVAIDPMT